ncbi:hypothetical protein D9M71_509410 [compost metagenome]
MDPGKQADAAVARRFVVQTKLSISHIDEYLLEQIGEHRIGDAFAKHQAYQGTHDPSQSAQQRRRECGRVHCSQSAPAVVVTWFAADVIAAVITRFATHMITTVITRLTANMIAMVVARFAANMMTMVIAGLTAHMIAMVIAGLTTDMIAMIIARL